MSGGVVDGCTDGVPLFKINRYKMHNVSVCAYVCVCVSLCVRLHCLMTYKLHGRPLHWRHARVRGRTGGRYADAGERDVNKKKEKKIETLRLLPQKRCGPWLIMFVFYTHTRRLLPAARPVRISIEHTLYIHVLLCLLYSISFYRVRHCKLLSKYTTGLTRRKMQGFRGRGASVRVRVSSAKLNVSPRAS